MSGKWIDVKGGKAAKAPAAAGPKKPAASPAPKKSPAADEALELPSAPNTPQPAAAEHRYADPAADSPARATRRSGSTGASHFADGTHTPRARTPARSLGVHAEDGATTGIESIRASHPRDGVPASPVTGSAAAASSSQRELNPHTAMTRYKAALHDIIALLTNPAHARSIDQFIDLTEEATKDLKKLKMGARSGAKAGPASAAAAAPRHSTPATAAAAEKDSPSSEDGTAPTPNANGAASAGAGKSWASLLMKTGSSGALLRSPSKKELALSQRADASAPEGDRAAAAAKGEARRAEAAERRGEKERERADDAKAHNAKASDRAVEVKQRQRDEVEAMREASRERHEQAAHRQEEALEAGREKAARHAAKVEEVLFVSEVASQNKAMRLEAKCAEAETNAEARREEQQKTAKERSEAREAALERSKELSQQRVDKAKEREQHRLEQVRRHEEQRRCEAEESKKAAKERERKVLDHKQAAAAEAETKKLKAEERLAKSQQIRDEQRAVDAAKRKEKDTKTKERLAEPATKTTVAEVMPKETAAEEEQTNTRLAKASATIARHARLFAEQYQKDCPLGIKDVNKSKFRALTTRLVASNGGAMSRQVLKDMCHPLMLPIDHEYARYFNVFEHLMAIITEARKAADEATFKLCAEILHKLLLDPAEGAASARYFVRAGHAVPLLAMIHDEIKALQSRNRTYALTACFSLLQCCVQCMATDAATNAKLAPVRDQLMELLEVAGVDKFVFAIASTCVEAEDMPCLQYALSTLQLQILLVVRKKTDATEWYQTAAVSLFTLLQNILNPGGLRAKDDAITHSTMLVILTSFRLLNVIARHKSSVIGTMLREQEGARMELFHMIGAFFGYVSRNETAVLERIPQPHDATHEASLSKSFEDALQFGMTLQHIPRAPLPVYSHDGTNYPPAPSSAHSSVSQTSTAIGGGGKGITRAAIHELLLFIGIAATGEPKVQEIFSWGKERPLLQVILTALNINYFNKGRHILFPTVLAIIARDDRNRTIAEREMDCKSLFDFLIGEVRCLPQKQQKKIKSSEVVATPSVGPAASPPTPPPVTEATPAPKKLFSFNWADVSDDDDDDDEEDAPAAAAAGPEGGEVASSTAAPAPELALQTKKDKMLQLVKNSTNYTIFFRIENRIPRPMWSDIGRFLEEGLSSE